MPSHLFGAQRMSLIRGKKIAHSRIESPNYQIKNGDNLRDIYRHTPIKASRDLSTCGLSHYSKQESQFEFRLLVIQEELSTTDKIVCILKQASIHTCGHYYALSYTWGENVAFETIIINGKEVRVTKHLETFLRCARNLLSGLPLWIDTICIDQSNISERNHQVSIMGQIYSEARKVLVWLGRGSESFASLFTRLSVTQDLRRHFDGEEVTAVLDITMHLLRLPYWSRAWIVQELLLARSIKLVYDDNSMEWDDFWEAIEACMCHSETGCLALNSKIRTAIGFQHYQQRKIMIKFQKFTMDELTIKYGSTKCTDIRDKIFAMRSLVTDGDHFTIDYSWTPAELAIHTYSHFGGGPTQLERLMRVLKVSGADLTSRRSRLGFTSTFTIDETSIFLSGTALLSQQGVNPTTLVKMSSQKHIEAIEALQSTRKQRDDLNNYASCSMSIPDPNRNIEHCHVCMSPLPLKEGILNYVFQSCLARGSFHLFCVSIEHGHQALHGPIYAFLLLTPTSAITVLCQDIARLSIIHVQAGIISAVQRADPEYRGYSISLPSKCLDRALDDFTSSNGIDGSIFAFRKIMENVERYQDKMPLNSESLAYLLVMLADPRYTYIMDSHTVTGTVQKIFTFDSCQTWYWKDHFACTYWRPYLSMGGFQSGAHRMLKETSRPRLEEIQIQRLGARFERIKLEQ